MVINRLFDVAAEGGESPRHSEVLRVKVHSRRKGL